MITCLFSRVLNSPLASMRYPQSLWDRAWGGRLGVEHPSGEAVNDMHVRPSDGATVYKHLGFFQSEKEAEGATFLMVLEN